ncbi:MAG: Gfo/Idh/MocA family oxidoreductase [Candidatus Brocadiaceae bacterium]|nr:Gfo/Idh/MocA family oxidoreductase [Candidatus Brocadiaceae bacterium]
MDKIRWGILATGSIAHKFAQGLRFLKDAEIVAVGSRTQEKADAFGEEWGVPHRHGSYEELAADPDVDVIYVATPHPFHCANSLLCLEEGKAVLCEKPFAVNAEQGRLVVEAARSRGLFVMEAVWMRFLPALVRLRELLAEGVIGEPRMVKADFCFRIGWNPESRLLAPELAGGALLDVGTYPINLASMVYGGPPDATASLSHLGETGVDEQDGIVFRYPGGALAVMACAVRTAMMHDALVAGTEGWIRVHSPFWRAQALSIGRVDEVKETLELPFRGNGYECEAAHVMDCLRAGRTESDVMPLDETLSILETLDALRADWGLKYPME